MRPMPWWTRTQLFVVLAPLLTILIGGVVAGVLVQRRRPSPAPAGVPQRIVSLAPSITEVLFAVGAGERVAGVTDHCDYPEEVTAKARIGGYDTPNVELVVAARPDLVLVPQEGSILGPVERLRALGLRIEPIEVARLDQVPPSIERIAALAGRAEAGKALAASIAGRIAAVRKRVEGRPRVRALLAVDHNPVIAAGPGTFGDDLLAAAGCENIAAGALASYPRLGEEAILAGAPALIVDGGMAPADPDAQAARAMQFWSRYGDVPAVRDGRIVPVDPDLIVRPGPRIADGLERLARAAHPEAFGGR